MIQLLKIAAILLPLAPFAYAAQMAGEWLVKGEITHGIALLLGALAALAIIEGILFKYWLLPSLGQAVSDRLYAGSYLPEQDELAQLTARIRSTKNCELLPRMAELVQQQGFRSRGWIELARLHQDLNNNHQEALQTLLKGAEAVTDKEDRAMLLYRAACLCRNKLSAPTQARELFTKAAQFYPNTVYGKQAAHQIKA